MDRRVERALIQLGQEQPDVEPVARRAWDALTGGSGEARDVSQWWLQVFCWDVLARDAALTPEQRWQTARALGDLLVRIGLGRYGELARSERTRTVLLASDDPERYRADYTGALSASGIHPPNTAVLTWGPVMGPAEADTYERVAHALELSMVSGDLVAGGRGSVPTRENLTDAVLTSPRRDSGLRPLHVIATERLRSWTSRSPTLAEVVAPIADELTAGVPVPPPAAPGALRPLTALLDAVREPVPLTSAGYLPPAVVEDVVTAAGLADEVPGRSRREVDVPHVHLSRKAAQRLGLVRVRRRALSLTARGRAADGPTDLALAVAVGWFPPRRTGDVVAREVVTALLAADRGPEPEKAAGIVRQVLQEEGWVVGGNPVPAAAAEAVTWEPWQDATVLGLADLASDADVWRVPRAVVPLLRASLRHHLLHHALSPVT